MSIAVLILAIIILSLSIYKPKYGVYLLALALPIIGRDFYVFGLIIPVSDFFALINLLAFFINSIFSLLFKPRQKIELIWPLLFPFALFFLANLISIYLSQTPLFSLYYFVRWPLFLYIAYIVVPANIIKDVKTLKNTIFLIFLSTLMVLGSGYLSLYWQDLSSSFFRLQSLYIFNSFIFGDNHNLVAEYLNIGLFFVLVVKEFNQKKRVRKFFNILFLITLIGLVLTFSRSAWITLGLQIIIYIYYQLKHHLQNKKLIFAVILLAIVIISPLLWRMNILQSANVSSTESRISLVELSFDSLKTKPWFGYGSGLAPELSASDIRFVAKYGSGIDAHGMIQKIIIENGIFGLVTWFFILIYLLKISLTAINKYYPRVKWILPFSLAVLGGIFFQFFNTSYYKGRIWFPVTLLLLTIKFSEERYRKISQKHHK